MNQHPARKHRDACIDIYRLRDVGPTLDVEDRGNAPAELRPETAREELRLIDRVRVEDAEEPSEVERVEDGEAVDEDQVLVSRPAADVEGAREVRGGDDAGEELNGAEHVRLGQAGKDLQGLTVDDTGRDAGFRLKADSLAILSSGALGNERLQHHGLRKEAEVDSFSLSGSKRDLAFYR